MPQRADVSVSVVAFQEGDHWIAQCVEYDICVSGKTWQRAKDRIERAIAETACINGEFGTPGLEGIPPAPTRFRALFEAPTTLKTEPVAPVADRRRTLGTLAVNDFRIADYA